MNDELVLKFSVDYTDLDEFHRLPTKVQDEIRVALNCLERMVKAGKGGMLAEYKKFAPQVAGRNGFNYKTLCRKLDDFIASSGNWRVLVNHSKLSRKQKTEIVTLRELFLDYWRSLFDGNQRGNCGKAAHRKLLNAWYSGESIPGYGTWMDYWMQKQDGPMPEICPDWFIPSGWDYSNLIKYAPSEAERALTRFGVAACKSELLHVPQTREGLRFLEWIAIDDVETDFLISVPDVECPVVMKCLVARDYATDMGLRFGARPALPKENEEGNHSIKHIDNKILLAGLLRTYGFPVDYVMNIIMERGTASLTQAEAAALEEITGGHVKVHFTDMVGGKALPHAFMDRAIGNPDGKSWLESSFNLLHNEMGFLPGQKGSSYQLRPKELEGRSRELKDLVKAGRNIPASLRAQLRVPFLNYNEATLTLEQLFRTMNHRDWHKLEGFEEVGIWRWKSNTPSPFKTMDTYPLSLPAGAEKDIEITTRLELPIERCSRLIQGYKFEKLPESTVYIFLEKHQEFVTVNGGVIEIQIDKKPYRFRDEQSGLMTEGAKYLAYYSRKDLEVAVKSQAQTELAYIYLTDARGAYQGRLPLWRGVTKGDIDTLSARIAEKERELKKVQQRVARRNVPAMEQRLEDIEHNLEVFEKAEAINVTPVPDSVTEESSIQQVTDSLSQIATASTTARATVKRRQQVDVISKLIKNSK
jgi:hypothetical protein